MSKNQSCSTPVCYPQVFVQPEVPNLFANTPFVNTLEWIAPYRQQVIRDTQNEHISGFPLTSYTIKK